MTWLHYTGVIALFFATHSIPIRPPVKARLVGTLGQRGFTTLYSLLSVAMLAAVIWAAGRAPFVMLWPQMPWQHHVVLTGMAVVCVILAFAIARPNPFSFGGARNDSFVPTRPGIVRWTRHPVLMALLFWSALHLLPNGDLAHVILFTIFAVFSALGTKLIDRRKKRLMGAEPWHDLLRQVKSGPLLPKPLSWSGVALRAGLGIFAYVALIALHPLVIGVSVLP